MSVRIDPFDSFHLILYNIAFASGSKRIREVDAVPAHGLRLARAQPACVPGLVPPTEEVLTILARALALSARLHAGALTHRTRLGARLGRRRIGGVRVAERAHAHDRTDPGDGRDDVHDACERSSATRASRSVGAALRQCGGWTPSAVVTFSMDDKLSEQTIRTLLHRRAYFLTSYLNVTGGGGAGSGILPQPFNLYATRSRSTMRTASRLRKTCRTALRERLFARISASLGR